MEAAAAAMGEVALDAPVPGEMPPGGMPADEIEPAEGADAAEEAADS